MRPPFAFGRTALLTLALVAAAPNGRAAAQQATPPAALHPTAAGIQQPDSVLTQAVIDSFARTHAAVATLRDRYQALFADPRNKKNEEQDALHEKLLEERVALLKSHGFTDAEFARLTRRVSADSAARRAFDEALARLAKQGPPPSDRGPSPD